ncbi:hypothetical protein Scep_030000 [Stephania cephalantha]|uniref:Uncharacterized protein n=1 Tax=Stephania cephalantha TaxID=152367 RepID=A0AAP0E6H2_9MAGN
MLSHSVKHKNDEPGEINLTSIASSRFCRNRASDRSKTRHRAVARRPSAPSLAGRRRRRSPVAADAAGVSPRHVSSRRVVAAVLPASLPALPRAATPYRRRCRAPPAPLVRPR